MNLTASSSEYLQINNISKHYGDIQALKDVSFDIRQTEVLGLIGPNGSGKTTLLEGIAGLIPLNSGTVLHHGKILSVPHRKQQMFYLPDGIMPYSELPVSRVLEFFSRLFGVQAHRMNTVITQLGLEPTLGKKVKALSKGFNRRYLLAVALLSTQPLLILDEPFDGLDLRQMLGVIDILKQTSSRGRTLLLSIHQLADAQRICDRFILLDGGRFLGMGTLEDLRTKAGITEGGLEEVFLALT
jgi:ABC-type multidrug transport system ATPase subunit